MTKDMDKIKDEVWSLFQPFQEAYFATCDGEKPFVRPITLIHFDKNCGLEPAQRMLRLGRSI